MNSTNHRVELLGCHFDAVTEVQALDTILSWRNDPDRRTRTIITVNVAILMMMRSHQQLREAVNRADLVLADGMPIVWTSRWLNARLPERASGVDLMERLLHEGAKCGLRVFLLGTTQERLDTPKRVIDERYPGVHIVGARNGYFDTCQSSEVTHAIQRSQADLLLVGMPAPIKEIWCEEQRSALNVPAVMGVGGAFDVLAGFVPRAPKMVQNAGFEWLWRLAMEPRKLWKRYLSTNSQFVALVAGELVKTKLHDLSFIKSAKLGS